MTRLATITVFAALFCAWSGTNGQDSDDGSCTGYGFGEEQEQEWGECWPSCSSHSQSPIDVKVSDATKKDLPRIRGIFYRNGFRRFNFKLTNENYTVTMQLLDADDEYLEGGPLNGRYRLHHLQFCWGADDSVGSEHTFNGQRYPMEAQWGLYNEKYENYDEASKYPGGVLRIAVLFPIQKEDNPSMAAIVRALPDVAEPGQVTTPDEALTYCKLFSGYGIEDYFHYNGSFTTPPCSETVMWFVYPPMNGNGISKEQVAAFRNLRSTGGPLVNNFRQTQPLNGRSVVRGNRGTKCIGQCD